MKSEKNRVTPKSKKIYPVPTWIPKTVFSEKELCPDCFKVVGEKSRYNLVCMLGQEKNGLTVTELTKRIHLKQPTVTHHLQILQSVNAVTVLQKGREKTFSLNRQAHCFQECNIPY